MVGFAGVDLPVVRECGDCVMCCEILEIAHPELTKPAGELCAHCTGTGCGIYEDRPDVCRGWYCLWRLIPGMLPEWRPDKVGVMFDLVSPTPAKSILHKQYIKGMALRSRDDFRRPAVIEIIEMFRQGRVPVWLDYGGRMDCAHPSIEVQNVLLGGFPPATAALAQEAEAWRKLYQDR